MRLNVYAEELTSRVEIVEKHVTETGATFIGVRLYLKTHADLIPPAHPDDDSSAVTLWVKSSRGGFKSGDEKQLLGILGRAIEMLRARAF